MFKSFNQEGENVLFPIPHLSISEKVKVAYSKQIGEPHLINTTLSDAMVQLKVARKSAGQGSKQLIVNNIAIHIISEIEVIIHHLKEQYELLTDRYQKLLSVCCGKTLKTVAATDITPEHTVCLGCNRKCNTELVDDFAVCEAITDTFKTIKAAYHLYFMIIEKLGLLDNPNTPSPQNILAMKHKIQGYLKLPPMEMRILLEDMNKELLRTDKTIGVLDEEIAEEEGGEEESEEGGTTGIEEDEEQREPKGDAGEKTTETEEEKAT